MMIEVDRDLNYDIYVKRLKALYNTDQYVFSIITKEKEEQEYCWRENSHYTVTKKTEYVVVHWTGKGKTPEQCKQEAKETHLNKFNSFMKRYQK